MTSSSASPRPPRPTSANSSPGTPKGQVKPAIDTVLPMSQVRDTYACMGSRQVLGKVVLVNEG